MFETLAYWGIPSAITGLAVWFFKKYIDKAEDKRKEDEKKRELREDKIEKLMLHILKENRATYILADATARAVQRIPDAHCNGDMTTALTKAAEIQKQEKDFVFDQGIEHIFGTQ